MDGLKPKLLKKVFMKEVMPTTIEGWYKTAAQFEGQWKHAKAIAGKGRTNITQKPPTPKYAPPPRDPFAMEVNRLMTSQ